MERSDDLLVVYHAFLEQLELEGLACEFLFVFDGGFGPPPPPLVEASREEPRLRILHFDQGLGETAALRVGLDRSRGALIITVPAYFQVRPEGLRDALAALRDGADMVVVRRAPRADPWINRVQTRIFHAVVNTLSHGKFQDIACGLRVMHRRVFENIPLYGDMHRFIPLLATRRGYHVTELPVPQHPRDTHPRVYRPGIYLRRLLDVVALFFISRFTEKPLRFFGLVGTGMLIAGGIINVLLLVERLGGKGIANRPLLVLGVLLISLGVQIIGLGLVGEIIVHLRSPNYRSYRIRETTGP
ncbi:MAG: glycosyltransferase [Gemmatimonadales bacterium]|nr:glycosyltransferase [Gemmatimonadales bacterium]NIN48516.1 glycosyltransferase [Gemmatimonadales bacterium]NIP05980.1 glycosyltransferase [Gemmatimonadales bacterium]NIQ99932.1 glycosyltransferase [Gemmatimonadales bacterium]NIS64391.1 glycosyltransferase [Gemmatimonadales bacterium]